MLVKQCVPLSGTAASSHPIFTPSCASNALLKRQHRTKVSASAGMEGGAVPQKIKVVGMGGCNLDYLASVAEFPKPDDKLRTEKLEVQGGGNAANALTAAARLGLGSTLVTKVGGDALGDGIVNELNTDGIDTTHVLRAPGFPSPFTYIIVDRKGGTRTCIHTPGAGFGPEEMTQPLLNDIIKDAALVYFDGRLAEAALLLARRARAAGVPVLVEGERLRPGLDELLVEADYVVTSANFPQDWTGEDDLSDALIATAHRLPKAKFIITTLGKKGAVLLERGTEEAAKGSSNTDSSMQGRPLAEVLSQLERQLLLERERQQPKEGCTTKSGLEIKPGPVAETPGPLWLTMSSVRDPSAVAAKAADAAARAATMNADASNAQSYAHTGQQDMGEAALLAKATMASISALPEGAVVDTTGAGDAFIGSVLYGLAMGLDRPRMLQLAATVAACNCTAIGARQGLPSASQLAKSDLLGR
ncbi:Ribokinase-like protein [Dunaliella salina]|uniref:Ribokinase-like protein n=1 Tax=Dunaliella salina TaxID=3046 RepID=A0ABQ7H587_DUNSA|nr:Ribokinase-like protein [Dunaliella salina]|eukprot:KAF5842011.1 Ribokinase-like protein [Dunaliella salina]